VWPQPPVYIKKNRFFSLMRTPGNQQATASHERRQGMHRPLLLSGKQGAVNVGIAHDFEAVSSRAKAAKALCRFLRLHEE
jgi:hypothetical protein